MQMMDRRQAPRLYRRRMEAIQEALIHRHVCEIEEPGSHLAPKDCRAALEWVSDRHAHRLTRHPARF